MKWFLKLHQDIVIIHTVEVDGNYAWGSVHVDSLFDVRNEGWYKELMETGSVYVRFEGEWI